MATRQRKKQRQAKTITKGGKTYTGTLYNGKVTVRMQRTAHGQGTVAGVLTVETGEWQKRQVDAQGNQARVRKKFSHHYYLRINHLSRPDIFSSGLFLCYYKIMEIEAKIQTIKEWLGTGSINIFGLPMSGKDTQGVKLAELLGAKFLSSGMIIRAMETETRQNLSGDGNLIPTNIFYEWVLPYFERPDLFRYPLILSSIGRWSGEEDQVMSVAAGAGHEIKAAIILNISEADVEDRFNESKVLDDRGERTDDKDLETFHNRLHEFRTKTLPVLQHYKSLGLLIEVNGDQTREAVFNELVEKLYAKASRSLV